MSPAKVVYFVMDMNTAKIKSLKLRQKGYTYQKIADELGFTQQYIYQLIGGTPSGIQKSIEDDVKSGKYLRKEIEAMHGLSKNQVSRLFRKFGVKQPIHKLIEERILSRVTIGENGCWNYPSNSKTYPTINFDGGHHAVHRLIYRLIVGKIPRGLWVLHKCDNKKCINPKHLYIGTPRQNANDREKAKKGISPRL